MRIAGASATCLLALALAAPCARAAPLGTLFLTPGERERLDQLRRGEPDEAPAAAAARGRAITGYVKRSDGRGTVWIDGRPRPIPNGAAPLLEPHAVEGNGTRPDAVKVQAARPR